MVDLPDRPDLLNVRELDLSILPMIQAMERAGIAVDLVRLAELSLDLDHRLAETRRAALEVVPPAFLSKVEDLKLSSSDQMGELLFDHLKVGEGRRLKKTSTGKTSTGKKQLELLSTEHPIIKLLLEHREYHKLKTTYVDKLPLLAVRHYKGECPVCSFRHNTDHWRIHTELPTTRADTGRLASRNPNLQNIPARTELGREVRECFCAEEGKLLVMDDLSQIELRVLAHMADEESMREVFERDGDIHTATAAKVFSKAEDEVDKLKERLPCKNVNFAVAYGETDRGLQLQLALDGLLWPLDQCAAFIEQWFDTYPGARKYMELQQERARRYGFVWDLFGRVRWVPEVKSVHKKIVQDGLRQAGNMPIQATAAGILKCGMASLPTLIASGDPVPLLPVHDELIYEANEGDADDWGTLVQVYMEDAVSLSVPVKCGKLVAERWVKD